MPLIKKSTEAAFKQNIARLIKTEKRTREQAVAIAYSIAKEAAKRSGKTPKWLVDAAKRRAAKGKKPKKKTRSELKTAKVVGLGAAMKAAKAKKGAGKKKLPAKKRAATKTKAKHGWPSNWSSTTIGMLDDLEAEFNGKKAKKKAPAAKKFKTIHCTLAKGLTRKEAIKAARKKHKGDHRGFTYNAKTGKATLT